MINYLKYVLLITDSRFITTSTGNQTLVSESKPTLLSLASESITPSFCIDHTSNPIEMRTRTPLVSDSSRKAILVSVSTITTAALASKTGFTLPINQLKCSLNQSPLSSPRDANIHSLCVMDKGVKRFYYEGMDIG